MVCRTLSLKDRGHIFGLYAKNKKILNTEIHLQQSLLQAQNLLNNMEKYHEQITVLGLFVDDTLVGMVSGFRWSKLPYYTIGDLKTDNPSGSFKLYISVFDVLLNTLTRIFEAEGRYDFYFVNRQRNFHKLNRENNYKQKNIPHFFTLIKRYELYIQEIIPPGSKSQFEAFNTIIGNKSYNVSVWIRKGSLMPEFRNKLIADAE
jgi:hypothetical protein